MQSVNLRDFQGNAVRTPSFVFYVKEKRTSGDLPFERFFLYGLRAKVILGRSVAVCLLLDLWRAVAIRPHSF